MRSETPGAHTNVLVGEGSHRGKRCRPPAVVESGRRLPSKKVKSSVSVRAWLPRWDSSGVTCLHLFSSSFSSLFSLLSAWKRQQSLKSCPPTPTPTPLSCSTEENAAQLTGPDLTPTLEFYKVACVSACCPQWCWVDAMWILEHEKILCGLQSLCTNRTLIQWCLHFPAWIRDNLGWFRIPLLIENQFGKDSDECHVLNRLWFLASILTIDVGYLNSLNQSNVVQSNAINPDFDSKSTDDCFFFLVAFLHPVHSLDVDSEDPKAQLGWNCSTSLSKRLLVLCLFLYICIVATAIPS